jgi:putative membrane protein
MWRRKEENTMTPDQLWIWHWGGIWLFPMIMFGIMIIFFFLFFRRGGCRPPWWNPGEHHREDEKTDTALEILKKRYAKGEITKDEFEQMKKVILSG